MSREIQPPAKYGRIARCYSILEYLIFANQLQKCRFRFWKQLESSNNLLILGDGNGRFSTHLLNNLKHIRITSLDASQAMQNAAQSRRVKKNIQEDRVSQIVEDILAWDPPENEYDAVVAQFFFDSFQETDLKLIISKIKYTLIPNGYIHVSEFNQPKETWIGYWQAKLTLSALYPAFRILTGLRTKTLVPHKPEILSAQFTLAYETFISNKTLVSQVFINSASE